MVFGCSKTRVFAEGFDVLASPQDDEVADGSVNGETQNYLKEACLLSNGGGIREV